MPPKIDPKIEGAVRTLLNLNFGVRAILHELKSQNIEISSRTVDRIKVGRTELKEIKKKITWKILEN